MLSGPMLSGPVHPGSGVTLGEDVEISRGAGALVAGYLAVAVTRCSAAISDEAIAAAEVGCADLAADLEREADPTALLAAPLVLRQAHATVEPEVGIQEFTAATEAVCPETLELMSERIDGLGS